MRLAPGTEHLAQGSRRHLCCWGWAALFRVAQDGVYALQGLEAGLGSLRPASKAALRQAAPQLVYRSAHQRSAGMRCRAHLIPRTLVWMAAYRKRPVCLLDVCLHERPGVLRQRQQEHGAACARVTGAHRTCEASLATPRTCTCGEVTADADTLMCSSTLNHNKTTAKAHASAYLIQTPPVCLHDAFSSTLRVSAGHGGAQALATLMLTHSPATWCAPCPPRQCSPQDVPSLATVAVLLA